MKHLFLLVISTLFFCACQYSKPLYLYKNELKSSRKVIDTPITIYDKAGNFGLKVPLSTSFIERPPKDTLEKYSIPSKLLSIRKPYLLIKTKVNMAIVVEKISSKKSKRQQKKHTSNSNASMVQKDSTHGIVYEEILSKNGIQYLVRNQYISIKKRKDIRIIYLSIAEQGGSFYPLFSDIADIIQKGVQRNYKESMNQQIGKSPNSFTD